MNTGKFTQDQLIKLNEAIKLHPSCDSKLAVDTLLFNAAAKFLIRCHELKVIVHDII